MKSGLMPSHWLPVYIASKHAMIGYTTSCAVSSVRPSCPAVSSFCYFCTQCCLIAVFFSVCFRPSFLSCSVSSVIASVFIAVLLLFSLCFLVCLFSFVCLLLLYSCFCCLLGWGGFLCAARQTFIAKEREAGITCRWLCCCPRVVAGCVVAKETGITCPWLCCCQGDRYNL